MFDEDFGEVKMFIRRARYYVLALDHMSRDFPLGLEIYGAVHLLVQSLSANRLTIETFFFFFYSL